MVSSIPSAVTGSGSSGSMAAAWSRKAEWTTGQDRPKSRAACATVRAPSATARPAASRSRLPRSRLVTRLREGICGTDSVNDERAHPDTRHRHRRFRHTNRAATEKGTSRGPVETHPFTEVESTPHEGHACGVPLVITCTTRAPRVEAKSNFAMFELLFCGATR